MVAGGAASGKSGSPPRHLQRPAAQWFDSGSESGDSPSSQDMQYSFSVPANLQSTSFSSNATGGGREGSPRAGEGGGALSKLLLHTESTFLASPGGDARQQQQMAEDMEVLKQHRVTRFADLHTLDLTKVDPALEAQVTTAIGMGNAARVYALMRQHLHSRKLLLTSTALCAAIAAEAAPLVKAMLLYPLVDYSSKARAPVSDAVALKNARLVRLLLMGPISDVNLFFPLARAVESGSIAVVMELLKSPRVNVNKGGALYRACSLNEREMVRLLLEDPRCNVNKFCAGAGSTALCRVIDLLNFDLLEMLLRHPRIDVNKGFLLTPLQHAVDTRHPRMVRLLLDADAPTKLNVNKSLGGTPKPFVMAMASPGGTENGVDIARALLDHPETAITHEMCDDMTPDQIAFEELVVDSGRALPTFPRQVQNTLLRQTAWSAAYLGSSVASMVTAYLAFDAGLYDYAVPLASVLAITAVGAHVAQRGQPAGGAPCLVLRLLPGCLYELVLMTLVVVALVKPAPRRRQAMMKAVDRNLMWQMTYMCCPAAALHTAFFFSDASDKDAPAVYQAGGSAMGLSLASAAFMIVKLLQSLYMRYVREEPQPGLLDSVDRQAMHAKEAPDHLPRGPSSNDASSQDGSVAVSMSGSFDRAPSSHLQFTPIFSSVSSVDGNQTRQVTPMMFPLPTEEATDTSQQRGNRATLAQNAVNNRPPALDLDVIGHYSKDLQFRLPVRQRPPQQQKK